MTHDLREFDDAEAEALPDVGDVFAPQRTSAAAPKPPKPAPKPPAPAPGKSPGSGDSVRGQRSAVKAPGGHDASRARDGG